MGRRMSIAPIVEQALATAGRLQSLKDHAMQKHEGVVIFVSQSEI